jgi:hypothetical protein
MGDHGQMANGKGLKVFKRAEYLPLFILVWLKDKWLKAKGLRPCRYQF